jgi:hypothetical protein
MNGIEEVSHDGKIKKKSVIEMMQNFSANICT